MYLRRLELFDAPMMLSWMHDSSIVEELRADFLSKTLADCEMFIRNSWMEVHHIHLAIASDNNVYMGTVSLKNIELTYAELGIVVCKEAMGKGYARFGMESALKIAFDNLELEKVYWCVSKNNKRAIRFYEKHGFHKTMEMPTKLTELYENEKENIIWFVAQKNEKYFF